MSRPYRCTRCGVEGLKLWRESQTFANRTDLLCASCATARRELASSFMFASQSKFDPGEFTDQIGWFVPAVPVIGTGDFHSYTNVPMERVDWWYALPTYVDPGLDHECERNIRAHRQPNPQQKDTK